MADHALLSASGSAKWLVCTPSARLEATLPDDASDEAREGTKAHDLCEIIGREVFFGEARPDLNTPEKLAAAGFTGEMLEAARDFVGKCKALVDAAKAAGEAYTVLIERKLDYSRWAEGGFGTGDFILATRRKVWVRDFKYGKGVRVFAEDNSQMMLYGLGALADLSFAYDEVEEIDIGIEQPRLDASSSWAIKVEDILNWANSVVSPAAKLAWGGEGKFAPGDHCTEGFCRARFTCRARADFYRGIATPEKAGHTLTTEEIAKLLPHLGQIASWAKAVSEYALKAAVAGTVFPGHKLVEGKSNRFLSDKGKAAVRLVANGVDKAALFPVPEPEMIGITAIQDLIGKKKFEELLGDILVKPAGKPTLVSDKDPRPVWQPSASAEDDFLF